MNNGNETKKQDICLCDCCTVMCCYLCVCPAFLVQGMRRDNRLSKLVFIALNSVHVKKRAFDTDDRSVTKIRPLSRILVIQDYLPLSLATFDMSSRAIPKVLGAQFCREPLMFDMLPGQRPPRLDVLEPTVARLAHHIWWTHWGTRRRPCVFLSDRLGEPT